MKFEHTVCSKTLAYKFQTPGNYPEERVQRSEHGKGLSRLIWSLTSVNDTVKQECLDEH